MIDIKEKKDCCGCSACVQKCPKQCISLKEDCEGFLYPEVDKSICIDCGLCEKVCPVLYQELSQKPLNVYAAINKNETIRLQSSSGGIFSLLAEKIINEGGVVFGARFDKNWEVMHDYSETIEGLSAFRGSKYVQSRIGNTYIAARKFLEEGRWVLFSGTSCQIAGLKRYLRKEYNKLLTVDVICHGVSSPLVWREYLKEINQKNIKITQISFRDKIKGWKKFSLSICFSSYTDTHENFYFHETLDENIYLQLFLHNLCLRPSCSNCPSKSGKCNSDISLADYWGIIRITPKMYDNKGTSLLLINTSKGKDIFYELDSKFAETSYIQALRFNPAIENSCLVTNDSVEFWSLFNRSKLQDIEEFLKRFTPSFKTKIMSYIKSVIANIIDLYYKKQ